MRPREFHYRWEYEFESSPEALWPLVADTNRFNRDAGVPAVEQRSANGDAGRRGRRQLQLFAFGVRVAWEEEPFEWIRPHRFGVARFYTTGPLEEMRVLVELAPRPTGGTRMVYQVWARPRNALGRLAIPLQIGLLSARRFAEVFRRYDREAREDSAPLETSAPARLTTGERERLAVGCEKLIEVGAQSSLVARLAETIERADDLTLARLRPYALADYWQAPRRAVLELCLLATRVGLLDLSWDLLCPLCRGAAESSATLKGVRPEGHCDSCRIDFNVNFDRSVEITFRPNASVRHVEARQFCVGGPQVTPHIVAQLHVAAGASRTLRPALEEGRYRLRASEMAGGQSLVVEAAGDEEALLRAAEDGWPADERRLAPAPLLHLENATGTGRTFILERTAWSDRAATAADVTALQLFRDLFATEALRPGDQISVGSLTILFTDLRDSTRLYRDIGDAVAFGAVMNHFDVLREAIKEEGGAMVKTIGDAVMAVFRQPSAALRAILRAQKRLAEPPEGVRPLALKAGIHTGPCIAVTLNGRLDYFGSNVNIAARLEPLSDGADAVVSAPVYQDPGVAAMLAESRGSLVARPIETALKGFDDERFQLWRIMLREKAERAGER